MAIYRSFAISSGHSTDCRGAAGYLDEVDEATRIVDQVGALLKRSGVPVKTFHDTISTSQDENLNRIVNWHNSQSRELDISVHLNAYQTTSSPMGTECLYVSQSELSGKVAMMIAEAGDFINRGPKYRDGLFFLNNTDKPAILIEICFVDSKADANLYNEYFEDICLAISEAITGQAIEPGPIEPEEPEEPGLPPPDFERPDFEPPSTRPTVGEGDTGPHVQNVQESLGIVPADGDFGPTTDGGVKGFQAACDLYVDGVVGPITWEELDSLDKRKAAGNSGLTQVQIREITEIAETSAIAEYSWDDRSEAPLGYTAGVALCFALAVQALAEDDEAALTMAQADMNDADTDALSYYRSKFQSLGMHNDETGIDTLRHLFVMLLGLGMRESSGKYCEGRDMSAENTSADEAEAGMFQTSWNIRSCCSEIPPLLDMFWENPNGFLKTFQKDVCPDSNDLGNYGDGDGARYQFLSKFAPAFHAYVTAIGMRYLRQHWGPINRNEVEIREEADTMLLEVQRYMSIDAIGPDMA